MAILSTALSSTEWEIVLNRTEMEETIQRPSSSPSGEPLQEIRTEPTVQATDIEISGSPDTIVPSSIRGSRNSTTRTIILSNAITELEPNQITILNRQYPALAQRDNYNNVGIELLAPMTVIKTVNLVRQRFLAPFLGQIRNRLELGLTSNDLPDSIIEEPAFLGMAELQVYDAAVSINDLPYTNAATYDTAIKILSRDTRDTVAKKREIKERSELAVTYRAAALLLVSFPELMRREIVNIDIQYNKLDIATKYQTLINISDKILDPSTPDEGDVVIVSEFIDRSLCF